MWTLNRTRKTTQRAFRPAADRLETREAPAAVMPLLYHSNPSTSALDGQVVATQALAGGGGGSAAFNSGGGVVVSTTSRTKTVLNLSPVTTPATTPATPTTGNINPNLLQTGGQTTTNTQTGLATTSTNPLTGATISNAGTASALTNAFGAATGLTLSNPIPFLGPTGLGNGTAIT